MATPLNLYATKVFAEQPLGLWALDDKADYVSFLDSTDQDLSLWANAGVSSVVDATDDQVFSEVPPGIPFPEILTNGIIAETTNEGLVRFTSPFQLQPENLNLEQDTFSFGLYVYSFSKIIDMRLGFRYIEPVSQEVFEVIKATAFSTTLSWAVVSETFKIPENFEDLELIIEVNYLDEQSVYEFAINAITAGQWAEEFQLQSFGASLINVPSTIAIPATQGLPALPYGLPTTGGYYIANNNSLVAKNLGVPLVFGSRNSTFISPKENSPSLIVPAFGFLNRSGQFNRLTAEFWIKIQSEATSPRKIFGPIASNDGIYVEGPFLKLKIGKDLITHYVREWDRPMLVDVRLAPDNATLIINGEQVGSLELDPRRYSFVESSSGGQDQDWLGFYAYSDVPSIQLDCIAIYPYEVPAIVAKRRWVYGQAVQVPTNIKGADSTISVFVDYPFSKYAKNYYFPSSSRWSSGSLENVSATRDYIAPTEHELPQLRFDSKSEEAWLQDLKSAQESQEPILTLKPNKDWEGVGGHLFFENLNFLTNQTKSFYGVFESQEPKQEPETLFEVTNVSNSNSLKIYTLGDVIFHEGARSKRIGAPVGFKRYSIQNFPHSFANDTLLRILDSSVVLLDNDPETKSSFAISDIYKVSKVLSPTEFEIEQEIGFVDTVLDSGYNEDPNLKIIFESTIYYSFKKKNPNGSMSEKIFYKTPGQKINQKFFIGLDLPRFVKTQGKEIANFLGTRQNLSVYIAGTKQLTETFAGKIHRIGFCTERNLKKIQHLFNEDGVPVDYANVFDLFGPSTFDAGANYFGDDLDNLGNALAPPPAFWSLVLDGGDPYDFATVTAEDHVASYTLIPKIYFDNFILDIAVDSYWEDYVPLSYFSKSVPDGRGKPRQEVSFIQFSLDYPTTKQVVNEEIDTSSALVKSYVAFQYLQGGSNAVSSSFTKIKKLNKDKVVMPESDWMNTKYEVVNGTVINIPKNIDIRKVSINVYLEMVVDGISTNPIKVRSLQLSSQAYGYSPNRVGTKFGTDLIPYSKSGKYFNYKEAPALSIYKGSTPYLYNTSDSGIELKTSYSNKNIKGISMPINKSSAEFFKVGSMQLSLKYGENLFPEMPIKIFEIEHASGTISFFLASESPARKRGQIYAVDENTKRIQSGLVFFNNGIPAKRPVLYSNAWTVVGISFPDFLSFSSTPGALRITSPIMFNNISYFQTNRADDEERFGLRQWFAVRSNLGDLLDWGYWAGKEVIGGEAITIPDEGFTWQEVLFLSSLVRNELDASNIYNIFTGTERIVADSDNFLPIGNYEYKVYKKLQWSSAIVKPV